MNNAQKIQYLGSLTGESNSTILSYCLDQAKAAILEKLYPFDIDYDNDDLPDKYEQKQIKIAVYLYNKRGAEGEVSHSEGDISRGYESADVPESMLKGIIPFAKVIGE